MLIRLVYSGELVSETYELVRHASNLDGGSHLFCARASCIEPRRTAVICFAPDFKGTFPSLTRCSSFSILDVLVQL